MDFGIILCLNFRPDENITNIANKAVLSLGFLIGTVVVIGTIVIVYNAHVKYFMVCGSVVVRSPHQTGYIQSVHKIQDQFVKTIGVTKGFRYGMVPLGRL